MIRDKPECWTWAVFASVLFQRWAVLEERKVVQVMSTPVTPAGVLLEAPDVARFVTEHIRGAEVAIVKLIDCLNGPAFEAAFGAPDNEDAANAEAIVAAAHEFGDCYQQVLEIAEECRIWLTPGEFTDLLADTVQLINGFLQDLAGFVNDVLARLEDLQKLAMVNQRPSKFQPVLPQIVVDGQLLASIQKRLDEMG
ncbi:hypothetical protein MCNF_04880 [Mycolicibacterium confluentis]|uniref:Uncharacterized protein n=2 Tax=Mycolicibacterium confluentis TaxID=28047 RepID=A0A7I7XS40_9MYCO|nr:hypothetical protein MCNF_04880 [Mycolicibacterium confluentis]